LGSVEILVKMNTCSISYFFDSTIRLHRDG